MTKLPCRVVNLEAGVAMVVTDLHGDWHAYCRYRDHFLDLQAHSAADYLIFTGDLIHSEGPPAADGSLDIVLDVLALRESLGSKLLYLLGNHELAHLYCIILQKGERLYTPRFEAAMGKQRQAILALFDSLPFYVRTRAGVTIGHVGASKSFLTPGATAKLFDYSHRRIWEETIAAIPITRRPALRKQMGQLHGERYDTMARTYLAVSGATDPRYDDLLIGAVASTHPDFEMLWEAFYTYNEREYGEHDYAIMLETMLQALSAEFHRQNVMATGHMACRGGYTLVNERQLRFASGAHAYPRQAARYLLLDTAKPIKTAQELVPHLSSLFE
jgi:hypothetical protein